MLIKMDETIMAAFFQWIEDNEENIDYAVMFESCEADILVFQIDEKLVKISFKAKSVNSPAKDKLIKNWIDFINQCLTNKGKLSSQEAIYDFLGEIFAHYAELKEFSSEDEEETDEVNYHEEIIEAIHNERLHQAHITGQEIPKTALSFYANHFVYKEAVEAVNLLEETLNRCPRLKYSLEIKNNQAFCNIRLEMDLAFLQIPDSVMVILGLNYDNPLVVSCSMTDIRLSQTTSAIEWTPNLLGFLEFDIMQAGISDSYGCKEYILGRVKKFREMIYNQNSVGSYLTLSRENSEDAELVNQKKALIGKLSDMGYNKKLVKEAVELAKGNEDLAIEYLTTENVSKYSGEFANDIIICNNFFYNLLFYLRDRIINCTNYCFICYKRHLVDSIRLRPCSAEMCEFRFEEISGVSVYAEISNNSNLVSLDFSFAAEAATSERNSTIFEPFPSFLLKKNQLRGKSGFLSAQQYSKEMDSNKDTVMLRQLITAIPNLGVLKNSCVDEISCRDYLASVCPDGMLMYKLMRYIIATNRLNFIKLEKESLIKGLHDKIDQYIITNHAPETEKRFADLRHTHGSFFAFHGSAIENWYSILRNGIRNLSNTHMMTAGAAYGAGVYSAENISTSYGYCRFTNNNCIWPYSQLSNPHKACMAIIEVVNSAKYKKGNGIYVITDDRDLIIRYLLIFPGDAMNANINVSDLGLEKHYVSVKNEYLKKINTLKKERIERAIKRAKENEKSSKKSTPAIEENKITPVEEAKLQKIENAFSGKGSSMTNKRIMQEYKYLINSKECKGLTAEFQGESNMYIWEVKVDINKFEVTKELKKDFEDYAKRYDRNQELVFEMRFDSNYPFTPPFLRVIRPRFAFRTGHITVGGSICMQSITPSGWIPVRTVESIFIEILFNMSEGGARLDLTCSSMDYQLAEAQEAFMRVARQHNWL